jgi:PAS domain-containing protein
MAFRSPRRRQVLTGFYADAEGVIRLWNRGAARIFGFTEAEALGCSLARPYCIRDHIVVEDGCALTGLDSRVLPSRAIELTAVFLDRKVAAILAHPCGASSAKAFARRGFHPRAGERCGDQEVATYLAQINAVTREFKRIEAEK